MHVNGRYMHMCEKFEISIGNISGIFDINEKRKIWLPHEESLFVVYIRIEPTLLV